MLEVNRILKIMGAQHKPKAPISKPLGIPPGYNTVKKIQDMIKSPMTQLEISEESGFNRSTVGRAINHLRYEGDLISKESHHELTGTSNLLGKLESTKCRSNTGLTGVSYNKNDKKFKCSYGRYTGFNYSTLLDAACKRKSLELWMQG